MHTSYINDYNFVHLGCLVIHLRKKMLYQRCIMKSLNFSSFTETHTNNFNIKTSTDIKCKKKVYCKGFHNFIIIVSMNFKLDAGPYMNANLSSDFLKLFKKPDYIL